MCFDVAFAYKCCYIHVWLPVLLHRRLVTGVVTYTFGYKCCYIHVWLQVLLHTCLVTSVVT